MKHLPIMAMLAALLLSSCRGEPDNIDNLGNEVRFTDYEDQYLLVNYWADWCLPCRKEIPEFNRLAKEESNLVILGINYDTPSLDELNQQIKTLDIQYQVLQTDAAPRLGIETPDMLPTSFLFGPGLELKKILVGAQTYESIIALTQ